MRKVLACLLLLAIFGCERETLVVIEDNTADLVTVIEHVYHTIIEEDSTPDIIREEDTTPDVVIVEDTTPDVVYEFYSDAADLPVYVWEDSGGAPPMPKKFSDLTAATAVQAADLFAITQSGTSKKLTLEAFRKSLFDPRTGFGEHDDFTSENVDDIWTVVNSGTGAQNIQASRHVRQLYTGTTTTGYSSLHKDVAAHNLQSGEVECDARILLSALSDATDDYVAQIGFSDQVLSTTKPTDGLYFYYNHATNGGNWTIGASAGGTRTEVDSGVAVVGSTWYALSIRANAAGDSVEFFINGASVGTITTNLPGSTQFFGQLVKIAKQAGTTSRYLQLDFYSMRQFYSTAR